MKDFLNFSFFIRYKTAIIKQSFSYFFAKFLISLLLQILNEVSQSNIFLVFFLHIWSFKVNSIFIISGSAFCSANSRSIGSFSSSAFPPSYFYYILLNFRQLVFQSPKFLMEYIYIVCFDCITTTRSNNSNVISII